MTRETWNALEAMFEAHPVTVAGPVPKADVDAAFAGWPFALPDDYRSFVEAFGGAIVGALPIYGLRAARAMGKAEGSALAMTERFRKKRWPGIDTWLIVSMDQAGNPIGLTADGAVWISDHDAGSVDALASSFEDFLRTRCLELKAH
jgi:hypothetical protein